ncbi:hypothetical protein [Sphingorhabdus sp. YGSMI21]|uniref:hypothetical protein n=1 Tax=Sphingorhabdus sp. YGSMI21 TaxID=2077182 RepID=UPI000C1EA839|nr:hypothetical protein [Sphingorhabdus sp. YGSMI21]ATW05772.1 hypothetical protein CHN51_19090 [Sphingorhabdus sp. YGSMI21]
MHILRSFGLILIACGLLVQSAAYASARPQVAAMIDGPCDEMRMKNSSTTSSDDQQGPCKNLRMDCLVALGCIPPLAMAADASAEYLDTAMPSQFGEFTEFSLAVNRLGPEPPPPQTQL